MKNILWIPIFLAVFFSTPSFSQDVAPDSTMVVVDTLNQDFGLFDNNEILHLALRFDISEYIRKKPKDEYLNAILTYYVNDRDSINKEIKLKSRGEFRNGYCAFPPLSLNFSKPGSDKDELKKIDKVKVVTHCMYGNENYLFKEYLIYRLYNLLTEYSFRVRLAKIEYISTAKKSKTISSYCFLIEPFDMMAERTKTVPVNSLTLTHKNIIPGMMDRVTIFNYMIGNTDWTVTYQHNCKVLTGNFPESPGLGIPVPYDFDYSGLVDAHYATPAEHLGLESVRQRRYLGLCRTEDAFKNALKEFSDKKSDFYRVISDFPYLSEKVKKSMISYLDDFYKSIDKNNTIITNFLNQCDKY